MGKAASDEDGVHPAQAQTPTAHSAGKELKDV